jgi:hypothetical protein
MSEDVSVGWESSVRDKIRMIAMEERRRRMRRECLVLIVGVRNTCFGMELDVIQGGDWIEP